MKRRMLLLLPLAACLRADSEQEVEDLIASAISGLSAGRPESFLEAFDPSMADFEKLRSAVVGLISQAELSCSLEVLRSEGDDQARTLDLDWILRIDFKDGHPGSTRRQKTVTCKFKKSGKKWRIVSIDPLDFFTPPGA